MAPPPIESRWRTSFNNFTTGWFLIPQGTGILAVILHQLDYQFRGLKTIAIILWLINVFLLVTFLAVYLARFFVSPRVVIHGIATNTTEVACLSSICIAFTSAIQMLSLVVVPSWGGHSWGEAAYVLWWINSAMAVVAVLGLPILFVHTLRVEGGYIMSLTPASQLPLIAALTSAAGAGTLCQSAMLSPAQQIPMIIVAYLEIGIGLPLAVALDILYMARVFSPLNSESGTKPLKGPQIFSEMVLCGPWGQSSFAFQGLGMALFKLQEAQGQYPIPQRSLLLSSQVLGPCAAVSMFMGVLLWGQGTFWWTYAVFKIAKSSWKEARFPFGVPTWSIVFPWVRPFFYILILSMADLSSVLIFPRVYIRTLLFSLGSSWTHPPSKFGPPFWP